MGQATAAAPGDLDWKALVKVDFQNGLPPLALRQSEKTHPSQPRPANPPEDPGGVPDLRQGPRAAEAAPGNAA
jgi:hypothetical protein